MDERYDTVRAIRTTTHRYVRNYSPHRPAGQHYTYAFSVQPSMRSWFEAFKSGRCNPAQSTYWLPKSSEELYEIAADPYELNNLVKDKSNKTIIELRSLLRDRTIALRDVGFIPEGMYPRLAAESTIYDYGQSDAYPIERIVNLADVATSRDPQYLSTLATAASDPHPVIRYWAAVGFLVLRQSAMSAKPVVSMLLEDDSLDVRVIASEAMAHLGEVDKAVDVLADVLRSGNPHEILAAQNAIEYLWVDRLVSLATARTALAVAGKQKEPLNRIVDYMATADESERLKVSRP
jgi:hypothetical protein